MCREDYSPPRHAPFIQCRGRPFLRKVGSPPLPWFLAAWGRFTSIAIEASRSCFPILAEGGRLIANGWFANDRGYRHIV